MADGENYFGVVRWCDDDLRGAIEESGNIPTDELVSHLRTLCEKPLCDMMIERGWEVISSLIPQAVEDCKRNNE